MDSKKDHLRPLHPLYMEQYKNYKDSSIVANLSKK